MNIDALGRGLFPNHEAEAAWGFLTQAKDLAEPLLDGPHGNLSPLDALLSRYMSLGGLHEDYLRRAVVSAWDYLPEDVKDRVRAENPAGLNEVGKVRTFLGVFLEDLNVAAKALMAVPK